LKFQQQICRGLPLMTTELSKKCRKAIATAINNLR